MYSGDDLFNSEETKRAPIDDDSDHERPYPRDPAVPRAFEDDDDEDLFGGPTYRSIMTESSPFTDVPPAYFAAGKKEWPEELFSFQDLGLDPHVPFPKPSTTKIPEKLPALGPEPAYLERYTSFLSKSSPKQILEHLFKALNKQGCDFDYDYKENRVSGVVYPSNSVCRFRARLYSGGDGRVLVEFQRRRGDAFAFSKFYKGVCEALQDIIERPYVVMKGSVPFKGSTFSQGVKETEVQEVDDSFLNIVFNMACSEHSDVKRQAVELLANLSLDLGCTGKLCNFQCKDQVPENLHRLVKENSTTCVLLLLLQRLLMSEDVVIARNAAVVLENVTVQNTDIRGHVINGLADCIFSVLDEPSTTELRDLQRRLANCLSTIADCPKNGELFKSRVQKQRKYVLTLERYKDVEDERLRDALEHTLTCLQRDSPLHHTLTCK